MAVFELQIRKSALCDIFRSTFNQQRFPTPTLNVPSWSDVNGKPLQGMECTGCTIEPAGGSDNITIDADIVIRYNEALSEVQAAGSLQAPPTHDFRRTLEVRLTLKPVITDGQPQLRLQWSAMFGVLSGEIGMGLPSIGMPSAIGIEADENIVAFRVATAPSDPVDAPIIDRLDGQDWSQLVPGQLFADLLEQQLKDALAGVEGNNLRLKRQPSAAWFPKGGMLHPLHDSYAVASATVVALHQCAFGIEIPIDITAELDLTATGDSLTSTLKISWDPDSTLCQILAGALLTPAAAFVVKGLVDDKVSSTVLGHASPSMGEFQVIHQDDKSITYQRTTFLDSQSPRLVLESSHVTDAGVVIGGRVELQRFSRGLTGQAHPASSDVFLDCPSSAHVAFTPPTVYLRDGLGVTPPRPFSVVIQPLGAWIPQAEFKLNDPDLEVVFAEPPGGHLPVGTATSAFIVTDCGVRWVDLGTIPPDHPEPTLRDIAAAVSKCMPRGDDHWGTLELSWLVDPPDLTYGIDPLREWTIGIAQRLTDAPVELVAVAGNAERLIGTLPSGRATGVQVVTNRDETLTIRCGQVVQGPPPTVFQRWIVPFKAVGLDATPRTVVAAGGVVAIRGEGDDIKILDLMPDDGNAQMTTTGRDDVHPTVVEALDRATREEAPPWGTTARLDRGVVAVYHDGQLLVGRAMPSLQA